MKPKIIFVYDHKYPQFWADGLWAALEILKNDFDVKKVNLHEGTEGLMEDCNFMLGWGAFGSRVDATLQLAEGKKGLCIAGNTFPPTGADKYDVLFYETKWYRPQIGFHRNIVQAFGINTDIYFDYPIQKPIVWDYLGVGAFATWKRWEKIIDKKGLKMVIGEYQDNNSIESDYIITKLISNHVMVSNMVTPYNLSNIYNWSRTVYIPADINGGGERAVLEAKACGCKVEIEDDNPKLKELLNLDKIPSHVDYALKLVEGITSCLQ